MKKKILVGLFALLICFSVSMLSVNAWAMSFSGNSDSYYETTGEYNATFYQKTNKLRHMSGSGITIQMKASTWLLVGYVSPSTVYPQFDTTTLNQIQGQGYHRNSATKAKGQWTGWSGGTISADLYLHN